MRELEVDPKIVADQLGHSVDVNLNVYSKTSLKIRKQALDSMESAVLEAQWSILEYAFEAASGSY